MSETNKLEDTKNKFPYLDILYLEVPTSKRHPRGSRSSRAAQFASFQALDGYHDEILDAERVVLDKKILDESFLEELDYKLQIILTNPNLEILVTYFVLDPFREGGEFFKRRGKVLKVDLVERKIIFHDFFELTFDSVVNIDIIGYSESE